VVGSGLEHALGATVVGGGLLFALRAMHSPTRHDGGGRARSGGLDPTVRASLGTTFVPDVVGELNFRVGLTGLVRELRLLREALKPAERLALLAPCMEAGRYTGIAVVTDLRVFEFRRRICDEVPLERVASTTVQALPDGTVELEIFGRDFAVYPSGITDWQVAINEHNHARFQFPAAAVAQEIADAAQGRFARHPERFADWI
jgi:hypothetical protein